MKNFAQYGWDEESDQLAEEDLLKYLEIFQPRAAFEGVVDTIDDLLNDERETVIAIDLEADETLFVRAGAKNTVTLQKIHQKLAEGHNIIVIHNHPNNTGASLADFSAAAWLDAEYMIVVNPDGRQHHHRRIGDRMVAHAPIYGADDLAAG